MEKFVPYEKLSKKEKRKLDQAKRQTWGSLHPATRKPVNSRAYDRKKAQKLWEDPHACAFLLQKRAVHRPPNVNIISQHLSPVHAQFLQLLVWILMKHPILKKPDAGCNMKIQKRSESNVQVNSPQNKSVESRGYVNDGTQQLHEITLDSQSDQLTRRGLFLLHFPPRKGCLFYPPFLYKTCKK